MTRINFCRNKFHKIKKNDNYKSVLRILFEDSDCESIAIDKTDEDADTPYYFWDILLKHCTSIKELVSLKHSVAIQYRYNDCRFRI